MTSNIFFNGNRISQLISIPHFSRSEYEVQELIDLTYSVPLFTRLRTKYSNTLQKKFASHFSLEYFTKNQYIYEKDDPGSKYFIVIKGEVFLCLVRESKNPTHSSSNSSEEIEDNEIPLLLRPRSKAITINPHTLYQFSQSFQEEIKDELPKEALENEVQDLLDFIVKTNDINENGENIQTVGPGNDFGQEALFPTKRRVFNAVAKTDVVLAVLSRNTIRKVIKDVSRERTVKMFEFLQSVNIFSKWSRYELGRILELFKLKVFTKGQYLYKQNDLPTHAYIIYKGSFAISKTVKVCESELDRPSSDLRTFSKNAKTRKMKIDLVIKDEKEVIGSEEIIQAAQKRRYFCVCNSAVGEVYEITQYNFLQKLVRPGLFDLFSVTLRADCDWLNTRAESLEKNDIATKTFDYNLSSIATVGRTHKKKSFDFCGVNLKNRRLHTRGSSERNKDYEKGWQKVNESKFVWNVYEKGNIHLGAMKKNNPRLAPPNFLLKIRKKLGKKEENKVERESRFEHFINR